MHVSSAALHISNSITNRPPPLSQIWEIKNFPRPRCERTKLHDYQAGVCARMWPDLNTVVLRLRLVTGIWIKQVHTRNKYICEREEVKSTGSETVWYHISLMITWPSLRLTVVFSPDSKLHSSSSISHSPLHLRSRRVRMVTIVKGRSESNVVTFQNHKRGSCFPLSHRLSSCLHDSRSQSPLAVHIKQPRASLFINCSQ